MAGATVNVSGDPMAGIASLLATLGGTKTTSNAGDTSALQSTLAGLQGQDLQGMLAAIFQQAGAQVPNLQSSMGRAVGARSSNNAPLAAALQKLLAQTTVGAQDQIAKQQLTNFQTQAQVGNSIAQATKGTQQQAGTNLTQAGSILAALAGLQKTGLFDMFKGEKAGTVDGASAQSMQPAQAAQMAQDINTSNGGQQPIAYTPTFSTGQAWSPMAGTDNTGSSLAVPAPQLAAPTNGGNTDMTGFQTTPDIPAWAFDSGSQIDMTGFQTPTNYTSEPLAQPWQPMAGTDNTDFQWLAFADGGLVGRDGKKAAMPKGYAKEQKAGMADGGVVTAAGSRRSANPQVTQQAPDQELAQLLASALSGGASVGNTQSTMAGSDMANVGSGAGGVQNYLPDGQPVFSSGGVSSGNSVPDYSAAGSSGFSMKAAGKALNTVAGLNSFSGALGGPSIRGGALGTIAGLANAGSPERAMKTAGLMGLNRLAPGLGGAVALGMNPSKPNAINFASSFNPLTAGVNAGLGLAGLASIGEIAQNMYDEANPNQMMTPLQQELDAQFRAQEPGDRSGGDGYGDRGPGGSSGEAGAAAGGANAAGPGGYADGGEIKGMGTEISDSIPTRLSKNEYVLSADTVDSVGVEFLDALQAAFHTPAAQQRAMGAR